MWTKIVFPPRMKKIPCSPLNRHWFITKTLRDHHGNNLTQTSCEILWSNVSPEQIFHCWHALKFDSSPVSLLALNVPQIHHGVLPYITVSTGEGLPSHRNLKATPSAKALVGLEEEKLHVCLPVYLQSSLQVRLSFHWSG